MQDHLENILLQNGLSIEISLSGVASIDFAGQVQISLWNSNAHSLVEMQVASVVQGRARVDNSFIQTMVEFNFGSQSQLDFVTDLEFYSDKIMCLQMVSLIYFLWIFTSFLPMGEQHVWRKVKMRRI